jgi:hypothetical protein
MPDPLHGGIYCISATMLQAVSLDYPGPWSPDHEALWQETLAWSRRVAGKTSGGRTMADEVRQYGQDAINRCLRQYVQLRFGRLCSYLRRREPDAHAGYSILVYRLSEEETREALWGPPILEADRAARAIAQ